jgi:hypothetical protein
MRRERPQRQAARSTQERPAKGDEMAICTAVRPGPAGTAEDRSSERIRPGTRALLLAFAALTALATNQLLVHGGQTERLWPWTIQSRATVGFLAAAYAAGFLLSVLSLRQRSWSHVRVAVGTVTVFTFLTLLATIVHAHRLHFTDADPLARGAAWFWLAVYVAVPLMGVLVVGRQEGDRPRRQVALRPLPAGLRLALAAQGLVLLAAGIVLFLGGLTWHHGMSTIGIWPWQLTPLSAQALGAWLVAFGVGAGLVLADGDLARLRVPAIAYTAFGGFQLVALLVNGSQMSAARWGYGVVLTVVLLTGAYGWWSGRHGKRLGHRLVAAGEQQLHRVPGRERPGEVVALAERAVQLAQRLELVGVLETLGDDLQVQRLTELRDGGDHGVALGAGRHAVDERLVDLQRVDREAAQVAQRRVTRTEVVEREPDAEVLEQLDLAGRLVGVLGEQRLGDLEGEQRRVEGRLVQRIGHVADEIRVLELAHRDVHAHPEPAQR